MRPFASHPDELISASVTGELTPLERRELDAHLVECPQCRATLDAFREQRNLLGSLPQPTIPRDMSARVRAGIQSGRFGMPWWRRPGGLLAVTASLATVAAAGLIAVFMLNMVRGTPNVAASISPSASAVASPSASAAPTPSPSVPLLLGQPGDLLYTQVTGSKDARKLTVIGQQSGASLAPNNPAQFAWGAPWRSAISPDGHALAFATLLDGKGTWLLFVTNLDTGATKQIGETWPQPFGRRLLWSPDGRYLAFTVLPDQGPAASDVWIYDRQANGAGQVTKTGNAYAASWGPEFNGQEVLWISLAANDPSSLAVTFPADAGIDGLGGSEFLAHPIAKADGVFAPLLSLDGTKAIFWRGTMTQANEQGWIFSLGGMPQLTVDSSGGVPSWDSGTSLFGDLEPMQGQAFASGEVSWAADSDAFAFWSGQWTGATEQPIGSYPDDNAVYAGRASIGPLTKSSALDLGKMVANDVSLFVVDVALSPDGSSAAVTLGIPGGEFSQASELRLVTIGDGPAKKVDGSSASPQPWLGPGIYVP